MKPTSESFPAEHQSTMIDHQVPKQSALAGMKVLDLSRVLAGPLCAQILGDLGAEVLKVESPVGDETRKLGKKGVEGSAPYFMGLNRNKRNIVLDFEKPEDRAHLDALILESDVVIENFLQGAMARWGFDYESVLAPRQPQLIYANISGFGWSGPLSGLPGYDAVAQALSGLMSINGHDETGPTRVGVPICDITTGLYASIGILAAWSYRHATGLGQRV
ncbi:MAG: CoA-transferase-like protein, partial [Pseudomonadota bacterium]